MKYAYGDLGQCSKGDTVVVTIQGDSMNVRLVDSSNYAAYRSGRRHTYYGGHFTQSPIRLTVPSSGHWYVVLDRGGYAYNIRWDARVERAKSRILPPGRSSSPSIEHEPSSSSLAEIGRNLVSEAPGAEREFDVFISHASEDKDSFVRPLAAALAALDLRVWYDEYELKIGDSLRRKIDGGLARSRYAVVVLSPAFFARTGPSTNWTGSSPGR